MASGDEVTALTRHGLDIADQRAVAAVVQDCAPDVIVNCAAWTAVDDCEADPERAYRVNAHAVGFLAEASSAIGAQLVQISTDYVFDGDKAGAYLETDLTNPKSVYGASKLAGEAAAGENATVIRTSWVCSEHDGNMAATVLRLLNTHAELRFVDDQRGRPTFTRDLAQAVRLVALDRASGLFHVTNSGATSWFEFAQHVASAAGQDPGRVLPISTADLDPPRPAARPANSELANTRFDLAYTPLRDFREPLAEAVAARLR